MFAYDWGGEKSCKFWFPKLYWQMLWLACPAVWGSFTFHLYHYAPAVKGSRDLLSKSKKKCAALWSMSLVSTLMRLPMPANLKIKMATSFSSSKKGEAEAWESAKAGLLGITNRCGSVCSWHWKRGTTKARVALSLQLVPSFQQIKKSYIQQGWKGSDFYIQPEIFTFD